MKRALLITILLLATFTLILTSGCKCAEVGEEACKRIEDERDRSHCYKELGVFTNDPWICKKATYGGTMSKCIIEIAMKTYNPQVCDSIPKDASSPQYTQKMCLMKAAIASGHVGLCSGLEGYQGNSNDLSPEGYSREICEKAIPDDAKVQRAICGEEGQACCLEFTSLIVSCDPDLKCQDNKCIKV